ncbi:unnamed protein product [Schistosoma turkestanicum]|nr:unnamed protein product [Schistosoma turkestanicum]
MNQFYFVILMIIINIFSHLNVVSGECRTLGQNCSKTVFSPCCENLYCGLSTVFNVVNVVLENVVGLNVQIQ